MSKQNETVKTLTVAGLLCLVCSIIVSSIVVTLRPQQDANAKLDMKKNILMSAGMIGKDATKEQIKEGFSSLETLYFDMETGAAVTDIDEKYDQVKAVKDPNYEVKIPGDQDVGGLSARSKIAKVYVKKTDGVIDTVILNQWGKGLWSTMYGFIALGPDLNTIKGFGYYKQGETPGLGGEVDNKKWKDQWINKKLYNEAGELAFKVGKGTVDQNDPHQVDGLSGATITGDGVTKSMKYWFGGNHGYSKVLATLKAGGN